MYGNSTFTVSSICTGIVPVLKVLYVREQFMYSWERMYGTSTFTVGSVREQYLCSGHCMHIARNQ